MDTAKIWPVKLGSPPNGLDCCPSFGGGCVVDSPFIGAPLFFQCVCSFFCASYRFELCYYSAGEEKAC